MLLLFVMINLILGPAGASHMYALSVCLCIHRHYWPGLLYGYGSKANGCTGHHRHNNRQAQNTIKLHNNDNHLHGMLASHNSDT